MSLNTAKDSLMNACTVGSVVKLKVMACHRWMSEMTSDAWRRFLKLMSPPSRKSLFPSWMNWRVDKKTPAINEIINTL